MRKYLIQSAAVHALVLGLIFVSPFFRAAPPVYWIDSFDFMGGGGGGGGGSSGPKATQMGQVVPQPVKMPLPAKPAPVQHEVRGEETWKVKNQKDTKVPPKPTSTDETVERGETPQKAQSNVIRLGTSEGAKAGEGNYDYGAGPGVGPGIGIGFGPGEGGGGFGFGSYLRLLRERIWSEWTQSAVIGSKLSCVVGLTVAMNGDTSNIKLEKSSGNSFYDNVAMRAVRNASPLPPLPPNFPRSSQRFNLQFRLQD